MATPGKAPEQASLQTLLQRWAEGKTTLKEVRGYSSEELYSIAKTAYLFFFQGRLDQARTLFQGLYAVDPLDPYFAKALGVVELAAGNPQGALTAYDIALKLAPQDAAAYAGRAEVRLVLGHKPQAIEDLKRAKKAAPQGDPVGEKAEAMLSALGIK